MRPQQDNHQHSLQLDYLPRDTLERTIRGLACHATAKNLHLACKWASRIRSTPMSVSRLRENLAKYLTSYF